MKFIDIVYLSVSFEFMPSCFKFLPDLHLLLEENRVRTIKLALLFSENG